MSPCRHPIHGLAAYLCLLSTVGWPAVLRADDPKAIGIRPVRAAKTLGANRFAVVIGIDEFQDKSIPLLHYAEADARALYDVLTDPQVGGIPKENATLLLGKEATTRRVLRALDDLRTIPRDATVFIFFSGHGAKEAGDAFWVTYDSELGGLSSTAVPDREIRVRTSRIPTNRLIMLLDCCYAAATVKEQKSIVDLAEALKSFVGKGRVTITASGSGDEAIESHDLKHGVFAHFLIQALKGEADGVGGPTDGIVTVPELTGYLDRTVADAARQRKGIQKPNIFMEEVEEPGKFLVTVDPQRIAELAAAAMRETSQFKSRLESLKQLALEDKITVEQHRLGKQLLGEDPASLDAADRERLDAFVELIDGKLPARRLGPVLDAIETPAQREARLQRERDAARARELVAAFNDAAQRNNYDGARQTIDELQRLSPVHGALPGMRSRLSELTPPVPKELTLDCGGGVKLECVLIPAGEFMMGSPEGEKGRFDDESPQHRVRISRAFQMGKFEVTQAQWEAVMVTNPSSFKGSGNLPVETVTWEDCQSFCRKLSSRTGQRVRLPTEAEWEYACRAGTTTRYCFGDSDASLGQYAWFAENSDYKTHDVGGKSANAWGLFDMHGNVWEWCADVYGTYPRGTVTDPTGPTSTAEGPYAHARVIRGSSWFNSDRGLLRSASRDRNLPGYSFNNRGFRVVIVESGPP